jgi:hypothetical protein
MAQNDTGDTFGYIDKRRATRAGSNAVSTGTPNNFVDIAKMRTRLTAISATAYSATNLDKMTENDMIWALRQADEAASI